MKCERLYNFGGRSWLVFGQSPDRQARVSERNLVVVTQGDASVLIDPGGALTFPSFLAALKQEHHLDGVRDIILTHDDPAAASSMIYWREAFGKDVRFHVPWLWAGDIGHFDADADIVPIPDAGGHIPVGNHAPLELVPAHYLYSPGSFSVYDKEANILYSGAIGCADLAPEERDGLYVKKLMHHVDRLAAYHQRFMASDAARTSWVDRVQLLEPSHLVPEKGPILRGIQVREFLEWFGGLSLGNAIEGVFDLDDDVPAPDSQYEAGPIDPGVDDFEPDPGFTEPAGNTAGWGVYASGVTADDTDVSAFAETQDPDPIDIPADTPMTEAVVGGSMDLPPVPIAVDGMPDPMGEPPATSLPMMDLGVDQESPDGIAQETEPVFDDVPEPEVDDTMGFDVATAPVPVLDEGLDEVAADEAPLILDDPVLDSALVDDPDAPAADPIWPPEPVLPKADEATSVTMEGDETSSPVEPVEDPFDPRLLVPDSIFGDGIALLDNLRELGRKFRLVTRSDFDGLVCAVLLEELDLIDDILFVHPSEVQHGLVDLSDTDLSTNLPYDGRVFLCFDHHLSEVTRVGNLNKNHIIDAKAPSAARVVYNYFGGHETFPMISLEMMDAVDKADAAQFSEEEVLDPRGWELLNFIMDPRTGLGRFRGFRIPNYELMMELIEQIRVLPIQKVLQLPDVKERVDLYNDQRHDFEEQLDRCARLHGKLVVVDLRGEETIYTGNRFLIYALFPEANISMHVMHGKQQENTAFAVGKSIFDRSSEVIVGDLMLEYGGGGHKAAGTCLVPNDRAEEVKEELIRRISETT